jgi:hypothetical protein
LIAALRDQQKIAEGIKCELEPLFSEIYGKSREEQLKVRNSSPPQKLKCPIVYSDPGACDCLPYELQGTPKGQPCPNNPYQKLRGEIEGVAMDSDFLERCSEAYDDIDLALQREPYQFSPQQVQVARVLRRWYEAQSSSGQVRAIQAMQQSLISAFSVKPQGKKWPTRM